MWVVLAMTDSADPDVYGPYGDQAAAEMAIPRVWDQLAADGVDTDDEGLEVMALPLRVLP